MTQGRPNEPVARLLEDRFPSRFGHWVALLVVLALSTALTGLLAICWTLARKNKTLLGFSLRHAFVGGTIFHVGLLLGAGDGLHLPEGSSLCRTQSMVTAFGQNYLSLWICAIMALVHRQADKSKFVPRAEVEKYYRRLRIGILVICTLLAGGKAFGTPVSMGIKCGPGDPYVLTGLFESLPFVIVGSLTIIFTVGVIRRTRQLGWSWHEMKRQSLPSSFVRTKRTNETSADDQKRYQNTVKNDHDDHRSSVSFSDKPASKATPASFGRTTTTDFNTPSHWSKIAPKSETFPSKHTRDNHGLSIEVSSLPKDESRVFRKSEANENTKPDHHIDNSQRKERVSTVTYSMTNVTTAADSTPSVDTFIPEDIENHAQQISDLSPSRRQSAPISSWNSPDSFASVSQEGSRRKSADTPVNVKPTGSISKMYNHHIGSSEASEALHYGRTGDLPKPDHFRSTNSKPGCFKCSEKFNRLCINPRISTFALICGLAEIMIGVDGIIWTLRHRTYEEAVRRSGGSLFSSQILFSWFISIWGFFFLILFWTHSSMRGLLRDCVYCKQVNVTKVNPQSPSTPNSKIIVRGKKLKTTKNNSQ